MKVYAKTDVGRYRSNNEDDFFIPENGELFCAVADGMGGCNAGEVASRLACEVFSDLMHQHRILSRAAMRDAVEQANQEIYDEAQEDKDCRGMGTTFTALAIDRKNMNIAHVGDSRAYLIRGEEIRQLTEDHSVVAEMVRKGTITEEEAKKHPMRNLITRALGTGPRVNVDTMQVSMEDGDVFFLCTDGLTGAVEDDEILRITREDALWTEKVDKLIQLALDNGSRDNVTCMFILPQEETKA